MHVQTPPWQSIWTVWPVVSTAVHPQAPLPAVHVGFSQTLVRSGVAGVAGAAAAGPDVVAGPEPDPGPAAGCCVEASGERAGEAGPPPPFAFAADAPEPRWSNEESVSAVQAVISAEEMSAAAMRR